MLVLNFIFDNITKEKLISKIILNKNLKIR